MRKTSLILALLAFGIVGCADNYETDGGWSVGEQPPNTVSYDDPRVEISIGETTIDRYFFQVQYPKTSFCVAMLIGPFESDYAEVQVPHGLKLAKVTALPAGCESAGSASIEAASAEGRITFGDDRTNPRATIDLKLTFPEAEGVPRTLRIEESAVPIDRTNS